MMTPSPPRAAICILGNGGRHLKITERLAEGVRTALAAAGLPDAADCLWEVPRQSEHGDYATNTAMVLARAARRPPRQIAELIIRHFPKLPEVDRLEIAGPGFLNVFLSSAWCAESLREILAAGADYGRGTGESGRRLRLWRRYVPSQARRSSGRSQSRCRLFSICGSEGI